MPPRKGVKPPAEYREDVAALPPALRKLLLAELAAGNTIAEVGHSFPAPPFGAYFKLTGPVTTRARASEGLVTYEAHPNHSLHGGAFRDNVGHYFILEPPGPPPPEPDMDAIRAAHGDELPPALAAVVHRQAGELVPEVLAAFGGDPRSPLGRFRASMVIDYEKWHDGIGYDLEALAEASPDERAAIERIVLMHAPRGWRDVEALAALDTPAARAALREALHDPDPEVRAHVTALPDAPISEAERTASLVRALETAEFYGGLTQTLGQVEEFHPPVIVDALLRGALGREGGVACHFAAMLMFVYGRAESAFDWDQRPFFLRFNTEDRHERVTAFRELCGKIGVDPAPYLRAGE